MARMVAPRGGADVPGQPSNPSRAGSRDPGCVAAYGRARSGRCLPEPDGGHIMVGGARRVARIGAAGAGVALLATLGAQAVAADSPDVQVIEDHWEGLNQ